MLKARNLELGGELGLEIKNGCTKGDWRGELTYVGAEGNSQSVLDLILERKATINDSRRNEG